MNNQHLLDRAYGLISNKTFSRTTTSPFVHTLHATTTNFSHGLPSFEEPHRQRPAHVAGVSAMTIDRFEGRYLLSGGVDSSVAIWDLEAQATTSELFQPHLPLSANAKTSDEHKLGITQVAFYPFDSLAFLTSSYDHFVKVYASETLATSAVFHLDTVVYNIALSTIASHLLVACATQDPNVRLIDLRSGANTHSLAGHSGAVLSTAWSPIHEHILVSGATDGSVRFWDIRRSVGELGVLDLENSVGVRSSATISSRGAVSQAHRGAVNGVVWTEDGRHLVTCGHDQRVRVWDTETGANTLANFGPMIRNYSLTPCTPILAPSQTVHSTTDVLFYPNEQEILSYELLEGKLIRRLRRANIEEFTLAPESTTSKSHRYTKDRITALAWRAHDIEMYSAHGDGSIIAWKPRTEEDAVLDEEDEHERKSLEVGKKRKRGILDNIYKDLTEGRFSLSGTAT
ncbi:hypothetical protein ACN47E_002355 [Coniothyrium glycines]